MRTDGGIEAIGLDDVTDAHHCLSLLAFMGQLSTVGLDVGLALAWARNESLLGRNGEDRGSVSTHGCRLMR
jgi:hypothetical protein